MSEVSNKLLDAFPYLDGSGRRRLVVGVLFVTGMAVARPDVVGDWTQKVLHIEGECPGSC
jgi:hypothetical protein